ncbi:MAG: ABC transporter [Desulfovibrio sp.]|nr:ABC transporter [Desulfovibrio sp.]
MRHRLFFGLIAFTSLIPMVVLILYVMAPGWKFPDVIPSEFNLHAIQYLWTQRGPLVGHLLSSLGYSLLTSILTFLLCIGPAHLFARRRFRGKHLLEGILLAPALVPAMTFSMGVHYIFIKVGLADTFIGIVLVLTVFSYPYMLRALTAGYQAFGKEYEQCAHNLGAGPLQRLWSVELPLLIPSAIAGGSVVFLVAFSEYFLVFLIGGGAVDSFTGHLFPYLTSSDRSTGSMMTLIFLCIPILLFFLMEMIISVIYRKRGMY